MIAICEHDPTRPALHPKQNSPIIFGDDPNFHLRIIQTLWMPNTCSHNIILDGNFLAYNWGYNPDTIWLNASRTLERLELLVGEKAGLKNEVTPQVRDFHRSKHSGLNYSAGILAGSTLVTEIFCLNTCIFPLLDSLSFWHTQRALGYLLMNVQYFLDIHVVGKIIER